MEKKILQTKTSSVNKIINKIEAPQQIKKIIDKYLDIVSPHRQSTNTYYGAYHHIDTSSHPPVFCKIKKTIEGKTQHGTNKNYKRMK